MEERFPAVRDRKAPNGWRSESGMFYRPEWGDRLEKDKEGNWWIVVKQMVKA